MSLAEMTICETSLYLIKRSYFFCLETDDKIFDSDKTLKIILEMSQ